MNMWRWILIVGGAICCSVHAEESSTNLTAAAVLQRVVAHRAMQDFALKARLFVGRDRVVPVEMLVHNTPQETRTLYRTGASELLVVQPVNAAPRLWAQGAGELTGTNRLAQWAGSQFTCYDLALPFLYWPGGKILGTDRVRAQDCYLLELPAPGQEPYARVRLWVDQKYSALLRVEAFDAEDRLVRRLAITSFKRLGDLWIPRGLEASFHLPQSSGSTGEKSRLEIDEGDYNAKLSAELFSEARFQPSR